MSLGNALLFLIDRIIFGYARSGSGSDFVALHYMTSSTDLRARVKKGEFILVYTHSLFNLLLVGKDSVNLSNTSIGSSNQEKTLHRFVKREEGYRGVLLMRSMLQ